MKCCDADNAAGGHIEGVWLFVRAGDKAASWAFLFSGLLDSGSLKIQYSRNRYYDQYAGRWTTHDLLGIDPAERDDNPFTPSGQQTHGGNLYDYVESRPVRWTDPRGQMLFKVYHCCCCMLKVGKVAKECDEHKPDPPGDDSSLEEDIEYLEGLNKWRLWCLKKIKSTIPSCAKCIWAIPVRFRWRCRG
jgi:RHS repeat-associated protein